MQIRIFARYSSFPHGSDGLLLCTRVNLFMESSDISEPKQSQEPTLKDKAAKGVFWGSLNNGLQQILNLIFGIVLCRILSAEEYGLVGMLTVFTIIAAVFQDSGFSAALANKKDIKHEDYNAVFWFSLSLSVLMYIILFAASSVISSFFDEPRLLLLSRVVFLSIIISGISVVPSAYLFKNLKIKERAIADISSLVVSGCIGIIMAMNGFSYWGLAIQTLVYVFISTCLKWYFIKWWPSFRIDLSPLKEMWGFSIKIFFTNIFFHISNQIYTVILGRYYSPAQVGFYTQGNKWQNMGSGLTTGIFTHLTQPLFVQAEVQNSDPVKVFRKLLRFAAFLSFPLMCGLAFIGGEFVEIALGEKWLPCVPILQILCVWGAMLPIWRLYNELLVSKGRSDYYLKINLWVGLLQILFAFLLYPYGIHKMLLVYLLVNFSGLFVCHYYANKVIGLRFFHVLKDILPYLLITLGVYAVSYLLVFYIENLYIRFVLKLFIPVALYSTVMILTKSIMFKDSVSFLKKNVLKMK